MLGSGVAVFVGLVSLAEAGKPVDNDWIEIPKTIDPAVVKKYETSSGECAQYVEHAEWKYRDNQYSLVITPTPCGRKIESTDTEHFVDELIRDYADPVYWENTHGLRHQLICHLMIAREKLTWNIEPWRPDVGLTKTIEGSVEFGGACNPAHPPYYDTP